MILLPAAEPISRIARTKALAPSKLWLIGQCQLRYLLETERPDVARISAGPTAALGIAAHNVIADLDSSVSPEEIKRRICGELQNIVASSNSSLLLFVAAKHGLAGLFSTQQVLDTRLFALRQASIQLQRRRNDGEFRRQPANSRPSQLGAERWFENSEHDIAGKVDLAYRDKDGAIHVVDFKLGRVAVDGQPKEEFLMQVAAYGLLVKHGLNADRVVLELIGPSSAWARSFDAGLQGWITDSVRKAADQMPRGEFFDPKRLANLGNHCLSCSYRPSCSAYKASLQRGSTQWSPDQTPYSFDFLGTLDQVQPMGDMARMRFVLADGRHASIAGMPAHLWPTSAGPGTKLEAYALGCLDVKGRAIAPTNFYVMRTDNPRLTAFSSLFVEVGK